MLEVVKEKFKKFPISAYVMGLAVIGIFAVTSLRQASEKRKLETFSSLLKEYEKHSTPDLLEELITKAKNSSRLKKQYHARLFQDMVLFRPDVFTKAWLMEPIRVKDNYDRFSEGSLLIAENKLEDALLSGEKLQKEITMQESPVLYAFNAFRIAILHDKLGHKEEAKNYFSSLIQQEDLKQTLKKAYKFDSVDVQDYIEARLEQLISSKN